VTRVTRVRVIGCGNLDAGDDAAGLLAVQRARARLDEIPGVEVLESGPALNVVHLLDDLPAAVVVDAVRTSGGVRKPGDIVRAEAGPSGLPAEVGTSLSSHGLGLAEAIGLAAVLDRAPRVVFLGVEALDATVGHPLSPAVAAALPELVELVVQEATRLAGPSAPAS
jgi:hydrogenase maturation protease